MQILTFSGGKAIRGLRATGILFQEQPDVSVVVTGTDEPMEPSSVTLRLDESVTMLCSESLARRLKDESLPIVVDYNGVESEGVVLKPVCLTDEEAYYATNRINAVLDSA